MAQRFALKSTRIVHESGMHGGAIIVNGDRIEAVLKPPLPPLDLPVEDLGDAVIMAGLVDGHVHINEPGRTQWEGFLTATRAALSGGITTVVDMPLNCQPVTTTTDALSLKIEHLKSQLHVDLGFWGGVIPGNRDQLSPLIKAGALGCKAFMVHSGIDDFPMSDEGVLREAMIALRDAGAPLLAHAEVDLGADIQESDPALYESYLQSRPQEWEVRAIETLIKLCRETGCHVHVVHLSAADAIPMIAKAKAEGLPFTVETCPHYLCLEAEEIPRGETVFKCAPPIRERENQERLWKALGEGIIDFVVSDHSPCTPQLKKFETGDFHDAWGGIASLQLGLPSIWTQAEKRGLTLTDLARWLSAAPARFAGLFDRKGSLDAGKHADLVIWDPEATWDLDAESLNFRHKISPYLGRRLKGVVKRTYLRGELAYDAGQFIGAPKGRPLFHRHAPRKAHERK